MEELRNLNNLFDKIIEAAPNAMIMIDSAGQIRLVNLQAEKMFGYQRHELLGMTIENLVPERFRRSHPALRKAFSENAHARAMGAGRELFGLRKDASEVPIEIGLNPLDLDGRAYVLASIIDITERKRAENRFRLAVEAAPNAMIMVDQGGKIIMANRQTEKLFRYERSELLGKPIEILVPERLQGNHPTLRAGFHANPQVRAMGAGRDLFGRTSTGEEIPVEIGLTPVETGSEIFVLASIIDITERKKTEQLVSSREAALEASRIKSQFLATMSHEMRTPLNGIIGLTNLLLQNTMPDPQRELLNDIRISADSLLALINDILDLSKIEANKMEFEIVNFHLHQVMADSVSVVSTTARGKNLRLSMHLDSALPPWFRGDAAKIRQVLVNLLGNAVKFTSEGSVTLRVRRPEPGQLPATLLFEVEDTGIGIPVGMQERLFEAFTQGDSSTRRRYGGSGLGLSISKHLVLRMGGQIGVESAEGKGSRFWFHLPLETGDEIHAHGEVPGQKTLTVPKDFRILVAEDNVINQKVALGTLRNLGLQGQAVANGVEALDILRRIPFDLVLMDCHMPEMDGFEATEKIRSEPSERLKKIPIIAMTANVMQGDREKCLEAGMNDYVSKPIDPMLLAQALERWIGAPLRTDPKAFPPSESKQSSISEAVQKLKTKYGLATSVELIRTFLNLTPADIQKIFVANAARDLTVLHREAHSLKSASLIVGATELSETAAALEKACREGKSDQFSSLVEELTPHFQTAQTRLQVELENLAKSNIKTP